VFLNITKSPSSHPSRVAGECFWQLSGPCPSASRHLASLTSLLGSPFSGFMLVGRHSGFWDPESLFVSQPLKSASVRVSFSAPDWQAIKWLLRPRWSLIHVSDGSYSCFTALPAVPLQISIFKELPVESLDL